jgi:phosphoserine phosphatase
MISVIIPALNEAKTVGSVVAFALREPLVSEVIVVDDGSTDGTPELARAAGAAVITSTLLGKGASMDDGLWAARNEVVLYLDGDLAGLGDDLIERMCRPILDGTADFVKAKFTRGAGRVTTLTARPLLRVFFPELAHFAQPLGGIVAARRSLLRWVRFENDYGVDIGLFLDVAATGAAMAEVDVGRIEHNSQPLEALGDMATQVARTLLDRAARYGRLRPSQVRALGEGERHPQTELEAVLHKVGKAERLALFDMDGVLLQHRFIVSLARRTNRGVALAEFLDRGDLAPQERARRIAALFVGVRRAVFEEVARRTPLMPGAVEAVVGLRRAGYHVGIVTDSYRIAAETVRRRVFADFSVAHLLQFRRGRATGQITFSPGMAHAQGCPFHAGCKVNVLRHLLERTGLGPEHVLAVGDGENDVCLLKAAGRSVAFRPKTGAVRAAAGHVVEGALSDLLAVLPEAGTDAGLVAGAPPSGGRLLGEGRERDLEKEGVSRGVQILATGLFGERGERPLRRRRRSA